MLDRQILKDFGEMLAHFLTSSSSLRQDLRKGMKTRASALAKRLELATANEVEALRTMLSAARHSQGEIVRRLERLESALGITVKRKRLVKKESTKVKLSRPLKVVGSRRRKHKR